MKKILIFGSLLFAIVACSSLALNNKKDETILQVVMHSLESFHFHPLPIDDAFSKETFRLYIDQIDHYKRFLLQTDIDALKKYELKIDDEINASKFEFFEQSEQLIATRIKEAEAYYKDYLAKPFDYTTNESIELDAEKLKPAANKKELKERWRLNLKYSVIARLYTLEQDQQKKIDNKDSGFVAKSFQELEVEAREKVLKTHDQWFKRLTQLNREDRLANYCNSITSSFDPHTNFFPPKEKENFDISLSGQLEGIGATLEEKDGYIKVVRLVPGSASWKQGQLEAGDKILKVAQGKDEPVDVVDMRLDDAVKLIRGNKGTEVRLTVEKIDGKEQVIPIVRDIVVLEETYAKSLILNKQNDKDKVGYIKLPKFYADFNKAGGRSCAIDVKLEVEKLKASGASGIIIDLRDNGGGSLQDVVDMGGLFVPIGPMVQIKGRTGAPYILSDLDPKVQFDGPLVILVNSLSASASEILAAAMQDYDRAIIMGTASTYGKGTVQRFVDLDDFLPEAMNNIKPLGSMKLTIQKFYRVNGGATQLKGVEPDVVFPDNYMYIEIGEREIDHAMSWDEINPASYTPTHSIKNKPEVIAASKKRIAADSTFALINEKAKHLKESRDKTLVNLSYATYKKERLQEEVDSKKYEDMFKPIDKLLVSNIAADTVGFGADSSKVSRNTEFMKTVKKDNYIFEALNVIDNIAVK